MSENENVEENQETRPTPRLNERILSSLSKRSVAAHPWHDLEIGTLVHYFDSLIFNLTSNDFNHIDKSPCG